MRSSPDPQSPDRIGHLRFDTFALALCAADCASGASVLCSDGVGGLAAAAVCERLGGAGTCCVVYPTAFSEQPVLDIVRFFNFSDRHLSTLRKAPLLLLESAFSDEQPVPDAALPEPAPAPADALPPAADIDADAPMPDAPATAAGGSKKGSRGFSSGRIAAASAAELRAFAAAGGFGSLLCCQPQHCARALLKRLLPLLAGGAPFALFGASAQPLAEAGEWAIRSKAAVCVELHEPWSREYQVLPGRTHPHMGMSATGGFLLLGTRVLPEPDDYRNQS